MTRRLTYSVLGPVGVQADGDAVNIGGSKAKTILAALAMNSPRIVSAASLVEILWGDDALDRAQATLQVHVSNLRKKLGDGLPTVVTQPPGYLLAAGPADLDLHAFEELATLARMSAERGATGEAIALLTEALAKWSGNGLEGIDEGSFAERSRTYLAERRLAVSEDLVGLHVHLGQDKEALRLLDGLLTASPLRESLWELKMLGLYRAGRQSDALAAFQQCRQLLDEQLGVDPSPRLRALEASILRQDPSLDVAASSPPPEINVAVTVTAETALASLELSDGGIVLLAGPTVIGRHPECQVVLSDPRASRQHAEVRPALGGHLLTDLGSSNGTTVNGVLETHRMLENGDVIEIGMHSIRYVVQGS